MCINSIKIKYLFFIAMSILEILAWAKESDQQFLSEFVVGSYLLLGKQLDSERTYFGKAEIYFSGHQLRIKRTIGQKEIIGAAAIEEAVHGEAMVLRMRFEESGIAFENTCLVQSDLDNYARISCYRYQSGLATENPGLEVLFIDPAAKF